MGASFYVPIDRPEKLLLCALADHASDDGTGCYITNARLQIKTSSAERTVRETMRKLEAASLVARVGSLTGGRHLAVDYELHAEMIYNLARANGWTQRTRRTKPGGPPPPFAETNPATPRPKPGGETSKTRRSTAPQPLKPSPTASDEPWSSPTLTESHPRRRDESIPSWLARINHLYLEENDTSGEEDLTG